MNSEVWIDYNFVQAPGLNPPPYSGKDSLQSPLSLMLSVIQSMLCCPLTIPPPLLIYAVCAMLCHTSSPRRRQSLLAL